jgi:predicted phage tail protein
MVAAAGHPKNRVSCLQRAKLGAGDATRRGCVKDRENGKLTYEVETLKHGKSKDITLDVSGTMLEVEQEVAASSLPPAVSDAIAKAAHSRKIGKVESVTRQGAIASYETTITSNGERREVAFSPQGAPVKAD